MEIIINGNNDVMTVTPDTSLGKLLADLRSFLGKHGQLAAQVVLDGQPLSVAMEMQHADTPVTEFKTLEIVTAAVIDQVQRILQGLHKLVGNLKQQSIVIGEQLQQGRKEEALTTLQPLIENLGVFCDGITYCATAIQQHKSDLYTPPPDAINDFKDIMARLHECLVAEEEVTFADVLLFELPDNLDGWQTTFDAMLEGLAAIGQDGADGSEDAHGPS